MAEALNPADAGNWYSWITDFDSTYSGFMDNWNGLLAQQNYVMTAHPELINTYNDLVARGQKNLAKLNELKATRDYVASWLDWLTNGVQSGIDFVSSTAQQAYDTAKSWLGLSGVPRIVIGRNLNGLGIAPLVVIGLAAAAAALVVIGYWIKDAYTFAQRLDALQQQETALAAGGPITPDIAARAQAIVDGTLGPAPGSAASINNNLLGIPWTWIIGGAVAIFVVPPLLENMNRKESRG